MNPIAEDSGESSDDEIEIVRSFRPQSQMTVPPPSMPARSVNYTPRSVYYTQHACQVSKLYTHVSRLRPANSTSLVTVDSLLFPPPLSSDLWDYDQDDDTDNSSLNKSVVCIHIIIFPGSYNVAIIQIVFL